MCTVSMLSTCLHGEHAQHLPAQLPPPSPPAPSPLVADIDSVAVGCVKLCLLFSSELPPAFAV